MTKNAAPKRAKLKGHHRRQRRSRWKSGLPRTLKLARAAAQLVGDPIRNRCEACDTGRPRSVYRKNKLKPYRAA